MKPSKLYDEWQAYLQAALPAGQNKARQRMAWLNEIMQWKQPEATGKMRSAKAMNRLSARG